MLYLNKQKGQQFLNTHPLQLHWDLTSDADLSIRNIKTNADLSQADSTEEAETQAAEEQVTQQSANATQDDYQQTSPAPRGAFSPDTNTITLTPNADLSTFIHELGHYFLETLTRHATELRARL